MIFARYSSRKKRPLIGVASAILALAPPATSSTIRKLDGSVLDRAAIYADVERLRKLAGVPGLAVALVRDGRVAYLEAFGTRDVASGAPLTLDTVMRGASLTKAMFAYLVMQLVDERRIALDRPIAAYLPRPLPVYPAYADLAGDARWRALTFRDLLDQTSGFANYRGLEDDGKLRFHWRPGTRYGYSGEGINLAQFVLEQGGLDLGAAMQARVFGRFGMGKSSLTWRGDFQGQVATGYSNGAPIPYEHVRAPHAASSLLTTPRDWSRFLAGVVRGDGLSEAAKAAMIQRQVAIHSRTQFPTLSMTTADADQAIGLGYGLGWGVFTSPYGAAFFKEGHDDGVANYALCIQPRQACILLMSNGSRAEGVFKALVDDLMGPTNLPWRWEGYLPYP